VTSRLGPFRIARVEHPSKRALKRKADLKDVHKVYFEDANGLDSAYFPYAEPEKQRRRGGYERFFDFTYRATVMPRIAEEWTAEEIGKVRWENEFYREARITSTDGDKPYTYSLTGAAPHVADGPALVRTEWTMQWPPARRPEARFVITLFLPERTFERDALPGEAHLWTVDDLDALLPED
jgi:hypothetical protein